jgi:hypothetical protein
MKNYTKIGEDSNTQMELEDKWCESHNKPYLTGWQDIRALDERFRSSYRKVNILTFFSVLIIITCLSVISFKYRAPNLEEAPGLAVLTLMLVGMIYFYFIDKLVWKSTPYELFQSIKKFRKDSVQFLKMKNDWSFTTNYDLKCLGKEVAEAHRRMDFKEEKRLMERFRKFHAVLMAFGVTNVVGDFGQYIPKPENKKDLVITLRQVQ